MDKENVVNTYSGMYVFTFNLKKKGSPAKCDNLEEPWKHSAKWSKPVTQKDKHYIIPPTWVTYYIIVKFIASLRNGGCRG